MDISSIFNKIGSKKTTILPGKPISRFWLETFIAITIVTLITVVPMKMFDEQQAKSIHNRELVMQVEAMAERYSQIFQFYHKTLQGISKDPALIQLFISNNGTNNIIHIKEKMLQHAIPGALRVRFLKPIKDLGIKQKRGLVDEQSDPPLGGASLDLIERAETETALQPFEVHFINKQHYLVGVISIRDINDIVIGSVHLTLDASILTKDIMNFKSHYGHIAIQQMVYGTPVTIFTANNFAEPHGPSNGSVSLKNSQLKLIYWNNNNADWILFISFIYIIVGLIVTCSIIFSIQYWRLLQAITSDQTIIANLFTKENSISQKKRISGLVLQEFAYVADAFIHAEAYAANNTEIAKSGLLSANLQDSSNTILPAIESATKEFVETATSKTIDTDTSEPIPDDIISKTDYNPQTTPHIAALSNIPISDSIFYPHDIRGSVGKNLTPEIAHEIGRALGSQMQELKQQTISVARDLRPSSAELSTALINGLTATGRDVIDLGVVPAPILYFSTHLLDTQAGIMISAGRAPKNHNGFKIIIDHKPLIDNDLQAIQARMQNGPMYEGAGSSSEQNILEAYIERIVEGAKDADGNVVEGAEGIMVARPMKVVLDCGNGCAGLVASQLFEKLGCDVVPLFCELDENYPNHAPDPNKPGNLKALQAAVLSEKAELGLAFDGEGDRLGVIDSRGRIVWPDKILMLLVANILASEQNLGRDIIFDVNCSRTLAAQIFEHGGRPVIWQTGHAALKDKLHKTKALLAGDWSGHIIYQERWYGFDDAFYAGARLLEILSVDPKSSAEIFDELPKSISTHEYTLQLPATELVVLLDNLKAQQEILHSTRIVDIDGLRAEYADGWGLVRASKSSAALKFRFEADSESALDRIQDAYRTLLTTVAPQLKIPF